MNTNFAVLYFHLIIYSYAFMYNRYSVSEAGRKARIDDGQTSRNNSWYSIVTNFTKKMVWWMAAL